MKFKGWKAMVSFVVSYTFWMVAMSLLVMLWILDLDFFKNVDVYGIWPNWNIGFVQISRLLVQKSRCETKFHYDNDPNGNLESPW